MSLMKTFRFKDCESKIYNEIKVITAVPLRLEDFEIIN